MKWIEQLREEWRAYKADRRMAERLEKVVSVESGPNGQTIAVIQLIGGGKERYCGKLGAFGPGFWLRYPNAESIGEYENQRLGDMLHEQQHLNARDETRKAFAEFEAWRNRP